MSYTSPLVLMTAGLAFLHAADNAVPAWPQFRGPGGTGIAAAGAHPPVDFGPQSKLLWKSDLPSGHSSPSIWGDRIFLTGFDAGAKKLEVLALNRKTGAILWRRAVPAEKIETVHEISSPATATPAVDGERVYAYFGSYGLIAFDFEGKQLWTLPLPIPAAPYGSGTSPIIANDFLILSRDESKDPCLLAVDRRTGATAWKVRQYDGPPPRGFHASTPVVWRDEIVVHHREEVAGFDVKTGARKWWVSTRTQGANTPAAGPDAIYVGTWFNTGEPDLMAVPDYDTMLKKYDRNSDGVLDNKELPESIPYTRRVGMESVERANQSMPKDAAVRYGDRDKDGKLSRAEWDAFVTGITSQNESHGLMAIKPGGHGNITASGVLWKESRGVPEVPAPLYFEDRVYAVTNGGIVTVINARSGALVFRERLRAGGAYLASPIAAGGRIYFASVDGVVSVVQPGDHLQVLAQNDFHEPLYATSAVIGGTIYVRTPTHLYALGAAD